MLLLTQGLLLQCRAKELDQICADPSIEERKKQSRRNALRKGEAQYLRFLRTKERPENFSVLKIIGKGAFGEVKLVKKTQDEKIYALKSLVKSEMVVTCAALAFGSRTPC